jgi:hypothetical protein
VESLDSRVRGNDVAGWVQKYLLALPFRAIISAARDDISPAMENSILKQAGLKKGN